MDVTLLVDKLNYCIKAWNTVPDCIHCVTIAMVQPMMWEINTNYYMAVSYYSEILIMFKVNIGVHVNVSTGESATGT